MQQNQQSRRYYITRRAAAVLGGILPASLATALYRSGHYCGIQPSKLPNGRLLWPADEIDAIAAGGRAVEAPDFGGRLAAGRNSEAIKAASACDGAPAVTSPTVGGNQDGFASILVLYSLASVVGVSAAAVSLVSGVAQ